MEVVEGVGPGAAVVVAVRQAPSQDHPDETDGHVELQVDGVLDQALDGGESGVAGEEEQCPRGAVVEYEAPARPFDDRAGAVPERPEYELGEGLPGVAADMDAQVHGVAGTAREPRFAGRSVLEPHFHPLAGEVAQHPCAPDPEVHDHVIVRSGLDPHHPRPYALRCDVVDSRRFGRLHHEGAARSDRAEQRVPGPLPGIGNDVIVETDPFDLAGDDPRPALPAAPVGAAERRRSARPQRGFEDGLPRLGLEPVSRGMQLDGEGHSEVDSSSDRAT